MSDPASSIRWLADQIEGEVGPEADRWRELLEMVRRGDVASLESELFGPRAPGRRSPAAIVAREERNRLLVEMAWKCFPSPPHSKAAQARGIAATLRKVAVGTDWKSERASGSGGPKRIFAQQILRLIPQTLSVTQIREILRRAAPPS